MTDAQDSPAEADEANTDPAPSREGPVASIALALGALAALTGVLIALYNMTGMADGLDETGVMILALSLFSPVIIAMFAGGVGGIIASRFKGPRPALAAAGFTALGLVTAGVAYALFGVDASIALALGLVLLGSTVIGGLFSLSRHRLPVVAGLLATLLLLALMFLRGVLETSSQSLFSDPLDRYGTFGTIAPFLAGLLCGFVAFQYLHLSGAVSRLPGFLFAGAIPGAIWLLATVAAHIGIETILAIGVDEVPALDEAYLTLTFEWQYNGAMTVLFAGALCSVLAYGLLLPKPAKRS